MDPDVRAAYQPYFERPEGEGLSRFLINFGLDLASRPPQGGLAIQLQQQKNQHNNI